MNISCSFTKPTSLRGRDTKGTFYGDDYITRAEVAAVAVRLVLPDREYSENR